MLVFLPGTKGPRVSLDAVLRERHEDIRSATLSELKRRADAGIPLDERVQWAAIESAAVGLTHAASDLDLPMAQQAVADARAALAPVLKDPGEYQPIDGVDGVTLRFVAVSESDRLRAEAELSAAVDEYRAAHSHVERANATDRLQAVRASWVSAAVADIDGLTTLDDDGTERAITDPVQQTQALRASGLLDVVDLAARWWQGLPAKKAARCGVPAPST